MENNQPEPQNQLQTSSFLIKPDFKNKRPLIISVIIFVLIGLLISIYFILLKNGPKPSTGTIANFSPTPIPTVINQDIKDDSVLKTVPGGYPVLYKIDNLYTSSISAELGIYSFSSTKLHKTNIQVNFEDGGVGFGSSHPLASPNFLYTAYIDFQTNNLWLLDNNSLTSLKITNIAKDMNIYISGWSPDSKNLLYFLFTGNMMNGIQYHSPKLGFFLYNLDTGVTKKLPIDYFLSILDNQDILTYPPAPNDSSFTSFNISTLKYKTLINNFSPNAYDQFSIDKNFKYWTFSHNFDNSTKLIYAPFPDSAGLIFASGGFAEVQSPLISPQGTNIAYVKQNSNNNPFVWIYNIKANSNREYMRGSPVQWISENLLIINAHYDTGQPEQFYIINLKSNAAEKIE